ncbi:MAG: hypothetical protein H0V29_01970 [Thermoleophilaceae bacterium]|nr:hypothetical protein [Thermoleophilaceae bacterium]
MRRTLLAALVVACLTGVSLPASSGAILVGVGDQNPDSFSNPFFGALGVKQTRLITPWNSITTEPARLDAWMQAARAKGLVPLVAFERARDQSACPMKPCKAPSVGTFIRSFKKFKRKYPWVRNYQPWNEVNSNTQPTGRRPKLAAQYYSAMRRNCKNCRVVAADILDISNMVKYIRAFKRNVKGPEPLLWGLHNYGDTNRSRTSGTENMIDVTNGEIWLTETGGLVRFESQAGREVFKYDEQRAAKSMKQMYTIAERFRDRITRIYVYQFQINFAGDRFDAGIVGLDGLPRPSFTAFKNGKPGVERIKAPRGLSKPKSKTKKKGGSTGDGRQKCIPSPLGGCQG